MSGVDLAALAEKVEGLTGPDRDVDCLIVRLIYGDDRDMLGCARRGSFSPTASLDAATTLFPPNTMYRSGHSALAPDPSMFFCDAVTEDGRDFHSLARTEANARLAAALRARAKAPA